VRQALQCCEKGLRVVGGEGKGVAPGTHAKKAVYSGPRSAVAHREDEEIPIMSVESEYTLILHLPAGGEGKKALYYSKQAMKKKRRNCPFFFFGLGNRVDSASFVLQGERVFLTTKEEGRLSAARMGGKKKDPQHQTWENGVAKGATCSKK